MTIDWDDVRYFLAVARHGSVRAAADQLEVNHTTVLRRAGTDQAALHGLLNRIQDLGLVVIDVHLEPPEPA